MASEMLVAYLKTAAKVAVLALYFESEDCTKQVRVLAGPPISKAVIGVEKSHFIFLQAMVCTCIQV